MAVDRHSFANVFQMAGGTAKQDEQGRVLRPSRNMLQTYFERYDLDNSGTVNSQLELRQMLTNIVFSLGLEIPRAELDKKVEAAGEINWNLDEFIAFLSEELNFSDQELPEADDISNANTSDDATQPLVTTDAKTEKTDLVVEEVGKTENGAESDNGAAAAEDMKAKLKAAADANPAPVVRKESIFRQTDQVNEYLLQEVPEEDGVRKLRVQLANIVEHGVSRGCIAFLIVFNAVIIGVHTDEHISDATFEIIDLSLCILFSLELAIKIFAFGALFFKDLWNVFDFFIVVSSAVDLILSSALNYDGASSIIRLLRIFRFFRLVAVLKELNLLVEAFVGSLVAVGWVAVLMIILLYIFGVVTTNWFGNDSDLLADSSVAAYDHFGTVSRSMLTLLQMITFDSWASGVARPIVLKVPAAGFFFVFFLGIAALGLMNLLTAIYVDKLAQLTTEQKNQDEINTKQEKKELEIRMGNLFKALDSSGDGVLSKEEVAAASTMFDLDGDGVVEMEEMSTKLQEFGLKPDDIEACLSMMSSTDDDGVNVDEFLESLFNMNDILTYKDVMTIQAKILSIETQTRALQSNQAQAEEHLKMMEGKMDKIVKLVRGGS